MTETPAAKAPQADNALNRRRRDPIGSSLTALCGGALALNLLLILGLLALLFAQGGAYFWQKGFAEFTLADGRRLLGEVVRREEATVRGASTTPARVNLKVANRDVSGADFVWFDASEVSAERVPEDAVLLERLEWGNFHGFVSELRHGDEVLASGDAAIWPRLEALLETKEDLRDRIRKVEKGDLGAVNTRLEALRLEARRIARLELPAAEIESRLAEVGRQSALAQADFDSHANQLGSLRAQLLAETLILRTAAGEVQAVPVGAIVRAFHPNRLSAAGKARLYLSRVREFLFDDPRESNTEGGIFPAIFGTVMMVLLMAIMVVPFGVLAALYLREYAKQGLLVRIVRIAVNNLAGVPSIVYGVFGLGFFVYTVGGSIDRLLYADALPTPTFGTGGILWGALTLALLTVPVVIVATEEGLASVPGIVRAGSLALGATKWETTWKVVVPAAAPGILTGVILAMARAAGEVAPLMIVGMVKLAPTLPVDLTAPFVHLERKFMHLGFHIYDVGFQSPNVEATKPLVFATALLLIAVVTTMNLVAIAVRNHLRRRYTESAI